MRRFPMLLVPAAGHLRGALACTFALGMGLLACGGHGGTVGFGSGGANGASGGGSGNGVGNGGGGGNGGSFGSFGGDGGGASSGTSTGNGATTTADGGMIPCPPGLMCNVSCPTGSTTISGKVYDPAGKNPLYNIPVYIPATPLQPLGKGVPMGADACSCGALFKSGSLAATTTAVDGTFTLTNVPVGDISLVIQVGKWRRAIKLTTKMCQAHPQPDKSLTLPGTLTGAGPDDNMPEIAVSTGSADTLECLMTRIGVPAAEYVAGAATTGHVHLFSGGDTAGGRFGGGGGAGTPEANPMPGAPASSTDLWMTQAQLMPYDITLLSCEGGETYNANPAALEGYLNAGGRAFGSHFHYSFFSGPLGTMQAYTAPTDWGPNLANWTADTGNDGNGPIGGMIDTTLNGSGGPFAKGLALKQWLGIVNALGTDNVPAADLAIYQPRYNSVVVPTNLPSQPWITSDPAAGGRRGAAGMPGQTMYFSFDTPVGKGPNYCGRAVFSDLHVAGNPLINDTGNSGGRNGGGGMPPPAGCDAMADLSPQEKALEFMLFDLSACVIPDTVTPPMRPF